MAVECFKLVFRKKKGQRKKNNPSAGIGDGKAGSPEGHQVRKQPQDTSGKGDKDIQDVSGVEQCQERDGKEERQSGCTTTGAAAGRDRETSMEGGNMSTKFGQPQAKRGVGVTTHGAMKY
eukprot:767225-Hanusia_phi.AAC.4